MEQVQTTALSVATLPRKTVTLSYIFRAIKDQDKLDKLIAEATAKGHTHISYEVVAAEDETSDTLFRRKQEDYPIEIPDFAALTQDAELAKFLELVTVEALRAEGQNYVNTGSPVNFTFDKVMEEINSGRARSGAGSTISAESLKAYVEIFVEYLTAKGAKPQGIELMSAVVKAKFSPAKVAPIGVDGVNRLVTVLGSFKSEVLDTDADILASLSPVHDHLLAKAADAIKPKEVDYEELLSF